MSGFSAELDSKFHRSITKGKARFSLFLYPSLSPADTLRNQGRIVFVLLVLFAAVGYSCSVIPFSGSKTWSSPEEIVYAYNDNYYKLHTLTGEAFLVIQSEEFNKKGTAHVVIKMPDSLRVRIEGPLGVDVVSFFLDSKDYLLYLHRDEVLYSGRLDSLNFYQLLYDLTGLKLSLDVVDVQEINKEIIGMFSGVSLLVPENIIPVEFGLSTNNSTILKLPDAAFETVVEFPKNRELLQKVQIFDENREIRVEKRYSRYIKQKGIYIPRRIRYTFFREKGQIALQYLRIQVNKSIHPEEFFIKIPNKLQGDYN